MEAYNRLTREDLVSLVRNVRAQCVCRTTSVQGDESELTRLAERLHQSDQAFNAMVEHAPDITVRFDRQLRHLYVSSAVSEVTGLAPSVFIGKTNQELGMPQDLVALWDRTLGIAFEMALEQRIEFSFSSPKGVRHFDARVVPEIGIDGKVNTVLSVARDITERKKYELAMQRNLELTQLLGSLARAANEALTPDAAMSACLEHICKQDGWTLGRVEVLATHRLGDTFPRSMWYAADLQQFQEFIHVSHGRKHEGNGDFISRVLREQEAVWLEDVQQVHKFFRRRIALAHGIKSAFAFPIIVGNAVVALIELFSTRRRPRDPLMMDAAQTIAAQLSRLVERELAQESNARLAALVESSQDAIILRAVNGTILNWNAGAEQLFGYAAAEIVGRNIDVLIPLDLREETVQRRAQLMQGKVFQGLETTRLDKAGRRIEVSQCISPIRDASGEIVAISNIMRDITERKHAERELQQQKKLLDAVIDSLPVSVVVKDAKTLRLLKANRVAEEVFLFGVTQSIGKTSHELFPAEQADVYLESDRQALQGRVLVDIPEQRAIGAAGDMRIRHIRKVPLFDEDGEPWVLVGIGEDITDRKNTEEELERQKKLLETIIEHLPVGIAVKDAHTMRYVLRNRMADAMTGITYGDAIGRRADEVFAPRLAESIRKSDLAALARGGVVSASPLVVQAVTGRIVRNLKVPVPDESSQYTHIVTIMDDVTDIEQAQTALRRSESRLNQLISMSPATIFSSSLDRQAGTTFISDNVTAQLGWLPAEFTSDPFFWHLHVHPDDRQQVDEAISRISSAGKYHCEYRFRHRDGSWHWMRDEGRTVCDDDGKACETIGSWTDITGEHQQAEMRLQRALLQRDTLVREVHHRIKNNIQGVIGLLRRKVKPHSGRAPEIEEAIMQLQTIAVVYGLQGKGANSQLSLSAMLDSICTLAENFTGDGVASTYQSKLQQPLYIVVAEAVAVAVALNELIFNALKHQAADAGRKIVRVVLREEPGHAEIRISNRGRLPPQFDFTQGRGVNDGLDLVKALLLQPGSDLTFNSCAGEVEVVLRLRPPLLASHAAVTTTG